MSHDQCSSLTWFFIGAAICGVSLPYKLGTLSSPGTGFMPFLSGGAISFFAAIGFLHATLRRKKIEEGLGLFQGLEWRRALIVLASLWVYALLFFPLGFLLSTALFIGFLLRAVVPQRWPLVIGGALTTAVVSYLIFEVWLKAQLPKGFWGI